MLVVFPATMLGLMVALIIVGKSVSANTHGVFPILPCNFEEGTTCQWLQGVGDDFDWTLNSGETPSGFTGPPYDHTSGNDSGHYLYTEASDPQQRGHVAHIISPYILPSLTGSCTVTFFGYMFGYHIGALRVLVQTLGNGTGQVVWEQQGQVGDRWVEVEVNLTSYRAAVFQVVIEGEIDSYQGDIAIDDISFTPGCERIEEGSVRLEDGTTPNEGRIEIYHNGAWGTVCNGGWTEQSASATCRQRGYKQAVSSGTRYPGPSAAPIWLSDVVCSGEEDGLSDCDRSAWGQTGACTHNMDVSVECSGFRPSCPTVHNECLNGQCVPRDRWCDFTDDCGDQTDEQQCVSYPGRCDFQHGLCDWIQPAHDDADWVRHSGSTPTSNTGPTADHLGSTNSYYLYLEASDSGHRDRAIFASPHTFHPSSSCKVRFYYHMYGRDAGYLRVFLTTSQGSQKVWELRGEQGNNWHRVVVPLSSDKNFQIYIEGEVGSSHIGDIGLDDISLSADCVKANDSCETDGFPVFSCGTGGCVPEESRCDFTWNCADGSDETNCDDILGRCDFERGFCSWRQNREDSADFTRARGADVQGQQLPVTDHTFDSFIGYYVYVVNASPGPTTIQTAQLESTIRLGQSDNCKVRFWYHFSGRGANNISVVVKEASEGHRVWVKAKEGTPVWKFASVMLRGPFTVFTVSLSASLDMSLEGAVAIDDISFSPSCTTGNLTHARPTTMDSNKVTIPDETSTFLTITTVDRKEVTTPDETSTLVTTTTGEPSVLHPPIGAHPPPPDEAEHRRSDNNAQTSPSNALVIGGAVGSVGAVLLLVIVAIIIYLVRSGRLPLSRRNGQMDDQDYDQHIVQYTTGTSQINLLDIGAPNMDDQGYATLTQTTHEYQSLQFQTPPRFICPISKSIMVEPVTASDGYTYDRTEIEGWLIRNQTSPSTNQKLIDFELVPNLTLKAEIDKYQAAKKARPSTPGERSPHCLTKISV